MMDRLVEKAGGRSPFPLVQGDATRMPFANQSFGAVYLRWVLHLIPDWRAALMESVRVTGRGGVLLLILLGSAGRGTTPEGEDPCTVRGAHRIAVRTGRAAMVGL